MVKFDLNYPEILENLNAFFIEKNGDLIPYQIEEISFQKNNFAKIKLAGVDSEEAAKNIVRSNIYLPDEFLPKLDKDEFYHHEIVGFTVLNEHKEVIGTVKQVYDLPANPLVEVNYNGKDVLIPLSLMESFSKEEEKLYMVVPKGLLDV